MAGITGIIPRKQNTIAYHSSSQIYTSVIRTDERERGKKRVGKTKAFLLLQDRHTITAAAFTEPSSPLPVGFSKSEVDFLVVLSPPSNSISIVYENNPSHILSFTFSAPAPSISTLSS
jgi:hypothetical protein